MQRWFRDWQGDDCRLETRIENVAHKLLGLCFTRAQVERGERHGQLLDDLGEQIGRNRGNDAKAKLTGEGAVGRTDEIFQFVHRLQNRLNAFCKGAAKGGQVDLAGTSLDQRRSNQVFQLLDLNRQSWLRHGAGFGRPAEMTKAGEGIEIAQVLHGKFVH